MLETKKNQAVAERKISLAEARAERTRVMSGLMANLKPEKRDIMESMLEQTKTSALRASFQKLLPIVLNENRKETSKVLGKKVLKESQQKATISTGNRSNRSNVEQENTKEEQKMDEITTIVHLAGIRSK